MAFLIWYACLFYKFQSCPISWLIHFTLNNIGYLVACGVPILLHQRFTRINKAAGQIVMALLTTVMLAANPAFARLMTSSTLGLLTILYTTSDLTKLNMIAALDLKSPSLLSPPILGEAPDEEKRNNTSVVNFMLWLGLAVMMPVSLGVKNVHLHTPMRLAGAVCLSVGVPATQLSGSAMTKHFFDPNLG